VSAPSSASVASDRVYRARTSTAGSVRARGSSPQVARARHLHVRFRTLQGAHVPYHMPCATRPPASSPRPSEHPVAQTRWRPHSPTTAGRRRSTRIALIDS
jgi:hypothetical protein